MFFFFSPEIKKMEMNIYERGNSPRAVVKGTEERAFMIGFRYDELEC